MAQPKLVRTALKNATPAQLIRVRALLQCRPQTRGFIIMDDRNKKALQTFDAGRFGDPLIADVLEDYELAEALR
jgi:hypothetical protein